MSMTWKEFKEEVDRQLKEKGVSENEEIFYIDISTPDKKQLSAGLNESSGIVIW